jgi:hypothetical protein
VLTALTVGLIWTILELTPKSALLSLTILYFRHMRRNAVLRIAAVHFSEILKTEI